MKKRENLLWSVFILLFLSTPVFAVWAPSTSLEDENNYSSPETSTGNTNMSPQRLRLIIERLEADERHLEEVIKNLEQREQKLNQHGNHPDETAPRGSLEKADDGSTPRSR